MSPQEREKWLQANTITCPEFGRIPPSQCEALRARPERPENANGKPGEPLLLKPKACIQCQEWEELCGGAKKNETEGKKMAIAKCLECGRKMKIHGRGLCGGCYMKFRKDGTLDKKYPLQGEGLERFTVHGSQLEKGEEEKKAKSKQEQSEKKEQAEFAFGGVVQLDQLGPEAQVVHIPDAAPDNESFLKKACQELAEKLPGPPDCVVRLNFSDHPELLEKVQARAREQFRTLELQILFELAQREAA